MAFHAQPLSVRYRPDAPRKAAADRRERHDRAPDPTIDELRAAIPASDGAVLVPGVDPGAADSLPFNLRTTVAPRVVVSCKTAHAITVSLDWARRHGIPLRGHSGGHSYEGFCSVAGLVIDVRPMDRVVLDPHRTTARVGAGIRLYPLTEKLFQSGVAIPAGTCAPVGVAGLTLGGGHGLSSRKFGLTSDNLLSARIVTADGAELVASESEHADLWWALRGGGGGNFGVVTEFTFKVHPVNRALIFRLRWRPERAAEALAAWQQLMATAPDELGAVMVIGGGPNGIPYARCAGQMLPRNAGQTPDPDELRALLRPWTNIPHLQFTIQSVSYLGAAKYFAGHGDKKRVYFKAKSHYAIGPLSDPARATLLQALGHSARPVDVILEAYGGAVNRIAPDATAFPHRGDTRFCMQYFAQWESGGASASTTQAVRAVHAAMRPHLSDAAYVNYTDLDLTNPARAYYGSNLPRLVQIKRRYDPDNVFDFPQAIPTQLPP